MKEDIDHNHLARWLPSFAGLWILPVSYYIVRENRLGKSWRGGLGTVGRGRDKIKRERERKKEGTKRGYKL